MVPSPTGRGVIVIGNVRKSINGECRNITTLIELSGDTKESLKWIVLDNTLHYVRHHHVSFVLPDEVSIDLSKESMKTI